MREDPEGEEGNGCLKYIVEVKTKSPIDERTKIVVVRNINLNIWKALDEHLPKDICCSVYSQDPEHDNQMREEGAKAERERVLDDVAQYIQKHTHCCSHMPLWVVTKDPLLEFIQSLRHRHTHEQQGTTAGGR